MSEGDVNAKLDKIIAILEKNSSKTEKIKEEIIEYMLKNYNISWLDDTTEKNIYEALFEGISIIFEKL